MLMAQAGYDPSEGPRFWQRFGAASSDAKPPEYLSTHPSDARRAASMCSASASVRSGSRAWAKINIDKDSIVSSSHFQGLQAKLRTFFRRPDLRLGLAAVEGDRVLVLNDATSHEQACIFTDSAHHTTAEFTGSLYERAVVQDRPVVIEDLVAYPGRTRIEEELIRSGVRTFICAPLHYQDRVIGTMELVSSHVGDLNATHLPKLQEVLPLFLAAYSESTGRTKS